MHDVQRRERQGKKRKKSHYYSSPGFYTVGVFRLEINFPCSPLSVLYCSLVVTLSSSKAMILPALTYPRGIAEDLSSLPETRSIIL